ncbi:hypothetical protein L208DRAFT_144901 [Tricholoma matsutake]|nr:hypothetical protein L208DRAFT_144901 [Tricholoma matsutake 945]
MIARRRFLQVLIAHLLVLRMFLEEARKVCPQGPLDRYRRHWLFLQLLPAHMAGGDIFLELTSLLNKASDKYLGVKEGWGEANNVSEEICRVISAPRLYIVLDEAQKPARLYKGAFRSAADTSKERPILREILSAWDPIGHIIVAGTGLSQKVVEEVVNIRRVVKTDVPWRTRTQTGAFESFKPQSAYISRYLPPHLVESLSGQSLLRRCWSWLQGRHRFTATFL